MLAPAGNIGGTGPHLMSSGCIGPGISAAQGNDRDTNAKSTGKQTTDRRGFFIWLPLETVAPTAAAAGHVLTQ
jgi:hypothetical protein